MVQFIFQPEQLQQVQVQPVLHASAGLLAGNDVAEVGDREDVFADGSGFCLVETLDAVGGEDEVEVEGAVLELDEVFAANDFSLGVLVECKAKAKKRFYHASAVFLGLCGEDVHILSGAGIAEEDGAAFTDEEVVNACGIEGFCDLLGLEGIEWQALNHSAGAGWKPR